MRDGNNPPLRNKKGICMDAERSVKKLSLRMNIDNIKGGFSLKRAFCQPYACKQTTAFDKKNEPHPCQAWQGNGSKTIPRHETKKASVWMPERSVKKALPKKEY